MKIKKIRKLFFLLSVILLFGIFDVNAKEVYYSNVNNVELTKEEYDFLSKMYWDGYQAIMTKEDYNYFVQSNMINGVFDSKIYNYNLARGVSHTTSSKNLKISKSCTSGCDISVVLTWLVNPTIRSYDVVGAYFDGVSLIRMGDTKVVSSSSVNSFSLNNQSNNGIGASIKLPTYSNIVISQSYKVSSGGTVYASYQHAVKNISLSQSQNYTFSTNGYGRVLNFASSVRGYYDNMQGVELELAFGDF